VKRHFTEREREREREWNSQCIQNGGLVWRNDLSHRRMASSGMLPGVDLVRTEVSEVLSASIIRVTRIGELGTMLAVTSN
jgi:hypothetical protein